MFILCFYTFTVYCAVRIYEASEPGIALYFGISPVAASLGLSLHVLSYGIGDLLFSPLCEIPIVGRNPTYYLTFIVFWVLSFPTSVVNNFGGFLALRFWLGFFGGPTLANGGATIGDMFALIHIPYGLSCWVLSAWCGPVVGPLIGGYAAMVKGWRWPMREVVWLASPVLLTLLRLMPETSGPNVLLRRARRLRKLTGDSRLQSQSEIDQRNTTASHILFSALVRPMEIMLKDSSIFGNLYTGYFYGVFYTFFEVFPLVFPPFYGFNLGETGLAFLACLIDVIIALLSSFAYLYFYVVPDNLKTGSVSKNIASSPLYSGYFSSPSAYSCSRGPPTPTSTGRYRWWACASSPWATFSPCSPSSSIFPFLIHSTPPLSLPGTASCDRAQLAGASSSRDRSSSTWVSIRVSRCSLA